LNLKANFEISFFTSKIGSRVETRRLSSYGATTGFKLYSPALLVAPLQLLLGAHDGLLPGGRVGTVHHGMQSNH
jgi:hypothetical protein